MKKLASKVIKNTEAIKGGQFGTGTRSTAGTAKQKAELL